MGLLRKKRGIDIDDEFTIKQKLQMISTYNDFATMGNNIEGFFNSVYHLKKSVEELIPYEKKYPNYFDPKPSVVLYNFKTNKMFLEKGFVERYIMSIERKLIDYTTERGKKNNFNKMVDLFKYYAGEFEPENVEYFMHLLYERFFEYLK